MLYRLKLTFPALCDCLDNAIIKKYRTPESRLFMSIIQQSIRDIYTAPRRHKIPRIRNKTGIRSIRNLKKGAVPIGTIMEDYCKEGMVFLASAYCRRLCGFIGLDYTFMRAKIRLWLQDAGIKHDIRRMSFDEFYR
jgi:hypothetical protein